MTPPEERNPDTTLLCPECGAPSVGAFRPIPTDIDHLYDYRVYACKTVLYHGGHLEQSRKCERRIELKAGG